MSAILIAFTPLRRIDDPYNSNMMPGSEIHNWPGRFRLVGRRAVAARVHDKNLQTAESGV